MTPPKQKAAEVAPNEPSSGADKPATEAATQGLIGNVLTTAGVLIGLRPFWGASVLCRFCAYIKAMIYTGQKFDQRTS